MKLQPINLLLRAAAGLLILGLPHAALANLIVQSSEALGTCSSSVNDTVTSSTTASTTSPLSICGNLTGTGSASYSQGLGDQFTFTGGAAGAQANVDAAFTDTWQIGGTPAGTPLNLLLDAGYNGNYSYSGLGYASLGVTAQIFLPNQREFLLNNSVVSYFCGVTADCPYLVPTNLNPTIGSSGSGNGNATFTATPLVLAADTTSLAINVELSVTVVDGNGTSETGTFTADYLDPFLINNIEVTNANTGQLVSGVTIMDSSGAVFPVNATPEPSTSLLAIAGLIAADIGRRNRKRYKKE